jgi:hypothetical protein
MFLDTLYTISTQQCSLLPWRSLFSSIRDKDMQEKRKENVRKTVDYKWQLPPNLRIVEVQGVAETEQTGDISLPRAIIAMWAQC